MQSGRQLLEMEEIYMKRPVFPLLSKIALILSGVLFFCHDLIKFLELQNIYIYISGVDAKAISPYLLIPGAFFLICAGAIFLFLNCRHIILRILIILLALGLSYGAFYFVIFGLFFSPENTYYEFTSNDQQHTIIVGEESWLKPMGCEFYEKTSFCTMKKVGDSGIHKVPFPMKPEDVSFVWKEGSFAFHYGDADYQVIELEYTD